MKNKEPLVSVIMGIYNSSSTLNRAIESILNQTYRNFEFIICDDKSTDSSLEILENFARIDTRVKIIKHSQNKSLSFALNNCLKNISDNSIFIARMDGDDYSHPLRLQTQVDFLLDNNEYDLVTCKSNIFDSRNSVISIRGKEGEIPKNSLLKGPPFVHPSIMIRRTTIQKIGFYNEKTEALRMEDYDYWFRFYKEKCRAYCLNIVLFDYFEKAPKKDFKVTLRSFKLRIKGFQINKFSIFSYFYLFKPFISYITPYKLKKFLRKNV